MQIPANARVAIVVVSQPGCPACEEYAPLIAAVSPVFARAGIPTLHLNAMSPKREDQSWMNDNGIQATPTTFVIHRVPVMGLGGAVQWREAIWKMEGAQPAEVVRQIYDFAYAQSLR